MTKKITTSKAAATKATAKASKAPAAKKATVEKFEVVVGKAKAAIRKQGDYMITSALLVAELRARVEAGDSPAGNVKWKDWAPREFNLSYSRIKELLIIGNAPNPERALIDMRANKAKRQAKSQANRAPATKALTGPKADKAEKKNPWQDTMSSFGKIAEQDRVSAVKAVAETVGLSTIKTEDLKSLRERVLKGKKPAPVLSAAAAEFDASEFGTDKERSGDRLKAWNLSIRSFKKMVPEDRAAFIAWAAADWKADAANDGLAIPNFLKRG